MIVIVIYVNLKEEKEVLKDKREIMVIGDLEDVRVTVDLPVCMV